MYSKHIEIVIDCKKEFTFLSTQCLKSDRMGGYLFRKKETVLSELKGEQV